MSWIPHNEHCSEMKSWTRVFFHLSRHFLNVIRFDWLVLHHGGSWFLSTFSFGHEFEENSFNGAGSHFALNLSISQIVRTVVSFRLIKIYCGWKVSDGLKSWFSGGEKKCLPVVCVRKSIRLVCLIANYNFLLKTI